MNNEHYPNRDDVQQYDNAFEAACNIYEPMGFVAQARGILFHSELGFVLPPFYERGQDNPVEYALRAAYQAGRMEGSNNQAAQISENYA